MHCRSLEVLVLGLRSTLPSNRVEGTAGLVYDLPLPAGTRVPVSLFVLTAPRWNAELRSRLALEVAR